MTDKKDGNECEGIVAMRKTDKDIGVIKTSLADITTDSAVNKKALELIAKSFETMAEANSLTHYKLFARTEKNGNKLTKLETELNEHKKHNNADEVGRKHRAGFAVSVVALSVSILTFLAILVRNFWPLHKQ